MKQNINEVVYNLLNDNNYQQMIISEFKENPDLLSISIINVIVK